MRLLLTGSGHATGDASLRVEKSLRIELDARYPGFALCHVTYRNLSAQHLVLEGWRSADFELKAADAAEPQFWSYCGRRMRIGATRSPVTARFSQDDLLGMTASDYGGGVPIADVWRRDCGLAVGHLETRPRLLSLPVRRTAGGVRIAIAGATKVTLAAGEEFRDAPHIPRGAHGRLFPHARSLPLKDGGAGHVCAAPTCLRLRGDLVRLGL